MAASTSREFLDAFEDDDHVLSHHYIRLFGRRPTPEELAKYRAARSRVRDRLTSRIRRGAALLITRL